MERKPRELANLVLARWMSHELHDYDDMGQDGRDARDALEELVRRAESRREMPCFCGTQDAFRCPTHVNPVQLTSGGR